MYNLIKNIATTNNYDKYHYVYHTMNLLNGKVYIGVHTTNDLDDGYMGSGTILKRAIKKYGEDNFRCDIIEFFNTAEDAYQYESELVDEEFLTFDWTYNLTTGGKGGFAHIDWNGKKRSLESRKKMSIAAKSRGSNNKGFKQSQKTKDKISEIHKGKIISDEQKSKISKALIGKMVGGDNPNSTKVIHLPTGEVFDSIVEAAKAFNLKADTLRKRIIKQYKTNEFNYV